jgi:tetratricopeptide (TPR) repeat protein
MPPGCDLMSGTYYASSIVLSVIAFPVNLREGDRMREHNSTSAETPEMISLMGYSLAKQSGRLKEGIALCEKAVSLSPHQTEHYLNLGRVYLMANKKEPAIRVFKTGLRIRKDPRIINELKSLGIRKPPFLGSLGRDHMLNILAGKVFKLLKLR